VVLSGCRGGGGESGENDDGDEAAARHGNLRVGPDNVALPFLGG
jgi:hypothetical protein